MVLRTSDSGLVVSSKPGVSTMMTRSDPNLNGFAG